MKRVFLTCAFVFLQVALAACDSSPKSTNEPRESADPAVDAAGGGDSRSSDTEIGAVVKDAYFFTGEKPTVEKLEDGDVSPGYFFAGDGQLPLVEAERLGNTGGLPPRLKYGYAFASAPSRTGLNTLGANFRTDKDLKWQTYDASHYTGISFWLLATHPTDVTVRLYSTHDTTGTLSGSCSNDGVDNANCPRISGTQSDAGRHVVLKWSDFQIGPPVMPKAIARIEFISTDSTTPHLKIRVTDFKFVSSANH